MSRQEITASIYDRKGRLLAVGYNSYTKTHPRQAFLARACGQPEKAFLHAEIAALVKCRGIPYSIYVERRNKQGQTRLAAPCTICQMAIRLAGIKKVSYTL